MSSSTCFEAHNHFRVLVFKCIPAKYCGAGPSLAVHAIELQRDEQLRGAKPLTQPSLTSNCNRRVVVDKAISESPIPRISDPLFISTLELVLFRFHIFLAGTSGSSGSLGEGGRASRRYCYFRFMSCFQFQFFSFCSLHLFVLSRPEARAGEQIPKKS
jgi:hypothetical protein